MHVYTLQVVSRGQTAFFRVHEKKSDLKHQIYGEKRSGHARLRYKFVYLNKAVHNGPTYATWLLTCNSGEYQNTHQTFT